MEKADIVARLERRSKEAPQSLEARKTAISLLSDTTDSAILLHDLLSKVVRPLFSKQQHPNLTATGRKKLVPDAPIATRHSDTIDWDDKLKIWRNGWTSELLTFILSQYATLPSDQERATFESHFHLLVPPLLNLIDDGDITYKTQGCHLLHLLCTQVTHCHSEILLRSGLSDVFADALRTNFLHLPTLTPEADSLLLLASLYPAFRALVDARFPPSPPEDPSAVRSPPSPPKNNPTLPPPTTTTILSQITHEKDARQALLDLILRQGILASYAHAGEQYARLATLLLREAAAVVALMGIYAAKHLQTLLPLLRAVLAAPFATACVPLLLSALACLEVLVRTCWPRVREAWWGECLRGLVGCWVRVGDDEEEEQEEEKKGGKGAGIDRERKRELDGVKRRLREITRLLRTLCGEDFEDAITRLVNADETISGLFEDNDSTADAM